MAGSDLRARAVQTDARWSGRLLPDGRELSAPTRERILARLRDEAGDAILTVELEPALVGVAEAAAVAAPAAAGEMERQSTACCHSALCASSFCILCWSIGQRVAS